MAKIPEPLNFSVTAQRVFSINETNLCSCSGVSAQTRAENTCNIGKTLPIQVSL